MRLRAECYQMQKTMEHYTPNLRESQLKGLVLCWYMLRFWIELGFRALKSVGWQWQNTRRTDPGLSQVREMLTSAFASSA